MKTLIEFYDKDVLKNIVAPLTLKPAKVIYFYDKGMQDSTAFASLEKCFQRCVPGMRLERYPVDISSLDSIYKPVEQAIRRNGAKDCMLELTGGSELMMIAGFRAGLDSGCKLLHTNLIQNKIVDLLTDEMVAKTAQLTLDDFVDARGARYIGESHKPPAEWRFDAIKRMSLYLFRRLPEWKQTCSYLQTIAAKSAPHELYMENKRHIRIRNGKPTAPDEDMMREFQKLGFLRDLKMDQNNVNFAFTSTENKSYCTGFGVWLELYVYIAAVESGQFEDVKLGTMIDWNAYDGMTIAGNEIDVILMEKSLPVFISCKLRSADTAALNELLIAKKRLGGWFSKGLMVTFSKEKSEGTGTYKRGKELGIEMLDMEDILAEDFSKRLVRAVKENDLISLKWKKI